MTVHAVILGVDSTVGELLNTRLTERGGKVKGLPMAECHWRSERQVKKALRRAEAPHVIDLRLLAMQERGLVPDDRYLERSRWIARTAQAFCVSLLLISSSEVFSGQLDRAYTEDDYPDGFADRGYHLPGIESAVREHCERHVVLRFGATYSGAASASLFDVMRRLAAKEQVSVCAQVKRYPITVTDAARVMAGVLDQIDVGAKAWGIYHYCGEEPATRYKLFKTVAEQLCANGCLPESAIDLLLADKSGVALNLKLDHNKLRNTFAIQQMPWSEALKQWVKAAQQDLAEHEEPANS